VEAGRETNNCYNLIDLRGQGRRGQSLSYPSRERKKKARRGGKERRGNSSFPMIRRERRNKKERRGRLCSSTTTPLRPAEHREEKKGNGKERKSMEGRKEKGGRGAFSLSLYYLSNRDSPEEKN